VTAPTNGGNDATFEVVINGETFVSKPGLGNQIGLNTVIALQSTSSNKSFSLVTGNAAIASSATTARDIGSQAKADALGKALERAFGFDGTSSKLTFQVGSTSADSLGVKIDSVKTNRLFNSQTLSIATQAGAATAGAAVDVALNTVTAIRASVGALQSRFDFAAANVQTSIQNQDAARGTLLDTDVTAESTAYATAQVQLQAGIAVLAQANQLPQNLLKLIS
jgi:flagellin